MVGEGINAFLRALEPSSVVEEPSIFAGFSLAWAPSLLSRDGVRYIRCRAWRGSSKRQDLEALRRAKLDLEPGFISAVADEMVSVVNEVAGKGLFSTVAPVACGHSRRPDCLSSRLAVAAAPGLGAEFERIFDNRFIEGSSHPKENARLPPLKITHRPRGPVLVVDDIATSGFHIREAVMALRSIRITAVGVVWISGVKQQ